MYGIDACTIDDIVVAAIMEQLKLQCEELFVSALGKIGNEGDGSTVVSKTSDGAVSTWTQFATANILRLLQCHSMQVRQSLIITDITVG